MKIRLLSIFLSMCLLALTGCGDTTGGGTNPDKDDASWSPDKIAQYTDVDGNAFNATVNSIVSTDALGRSFGEADVSGSDKNVGMFYFVWHGETSTTAVYDLSQLLQKTPAMVWSTTDNIYSPVEKFHYWGEPLYGYYSSDDPYIIKRHLELLTMSSVDYLCFDLTNLLVYEDNILLVIEEIQRLQAQGWNPPQIMCMLGDNTACTENITKVYEYFYKNDEYKSAWYCQDGKPVISIDMDRDYAGLSSEIKQFFTFRNTLWPYEEENEEHAEMPWSDWAYPQYITKEGYMNLTVAQHPGYPFSNSVNPAVKDELYNSNKGRGWDYKTGKNNPDNVLSGSNLEAQWANAITNKSTVNEIMVTGWNEWIAKKHLNYNQASIGLASFVDLVTMEFSRDLEMMKDGYGDNFYLQNMRNLRSFKSGNELYYKGAYGVAGLNEEEWANARVYNDVVGDVVERNHRGMAANSKYQNTTNRTDVQSVEVMNDSDNLYIRINTANDITFDEAMTNNLNVLLSVKGLKAPAWEGYNFVLNRSAAGAGLSKTSLDRIAENGKYTFSKVSDCSSYLSDRCFVVKIPLKDLGITDHSSFTVDFKVTDNITNHEDIINCYIDGESAPIGRLNYRYHGGV